MADLREEKISGERLFEGRVFAVERDTVSLPDGKTATREIVRHNGGVCVAAVDDERNIYFVRQFRYAFGRELDELPAGKLEKGEDPDSAAARELLEETGFSAGRLERVAVNYPSPGYTSEQLHLYIASELEFVGQKLDEDEFLSVYKQPLSQAVERVLSGEINDGKSQTLILLADRCFKEEK